jgi:hypothetical protein
MGFPLHTLSSRTPIFFNGFELGRLELNAVQTHRLGHHHHHYPLSPLIEGLAGHDGGELPHHAPMAPEAATRRAVRSLTARLVVSAPCASSRRTDSSCPCGAQESMSSQ